MMSFGPRGRLLPGRNLTHKLVDALDPRIVSRCAGSNDFKVLTVKTLRALEQPRPSTRDDPVVSRILEVTAILLSETAPNEDAVRTSLLRLVRDVLVGAAQHVDVVLQLADVVTGQGVARPLHLDDDRLPGICQREEVEPSRSLVGCHFDAELLGDHPVQTGFVTKDVPRRVEQPRMGLDEILHIGLLSCLRADHRLKLRDDLEPPTHDPGQIHGFLDVPLAEQANKLFPHTWVCHVELPNERHEVVVVVRTHEERDQLVETFLVDGVDACQSRGCLLKLRPYALGETIKVRDRRDPLLNPSLVLFLTSGRPVPQEPTGPGPGPTAEAARRADLPRGLRICPWR